MRLFMILVAAATLQVVSVERAAAQALGCHLTDSSIGPPRQVLHCDSGLVIEAESAANVRVIDQTHKGIPDAAKISAGAALIEVPRHYRGGFQILTPRAVASVRGTIWAVDAAPDQTSVFVVRGEVAVKRPNDVNEVTLGPGQGVDVDDSGSTLQVTQWARERVDALLARFGR